MQLPTAGGLLPDAHGAPLMSAGMHLPPMGHMLQPPQRTQQQADAWVSDPGLAGPGSVDPGLAGLGSMVHGLAGPGSKPSMEFAGMHNEGTQWLMQTTEPQQALQQLQQQHLQLAQPQVHVQPPPLLAQPPQVPQTQQLAQPQQPPLQAQLVQPQQLPGEMPMDAHCSAAWQPLMSTQPAAVPPLAPWQPMGQPAAVPPLAQPAAGQPVPWQPCVPMGMMGMMGSGPQVTPEQPPRPSTEEGDWQPQLAPRAWQHPCGESPGAPEELGRHASPT